MCVPLESLVNEKSKIEKFMAIFLVGIKRSSHRLKPTLETTALAIYVGFRLEKASERERIKRNICNFGISFVITGNKAAYNILDMDGINDSNM